MLIEIYRPELHGLLSPHSTTSRPVGKTRLQVPLAVPLLKYLPQPSRYRQPAFLGVFFQRRRSRSLQFRLDEYDVRRLPERGASGFFLGFLGLFRLAHAVSIMRALVSVYRKYFWENGSGDLFRYTESV